MFGLYLFKFICITLLVVFAISILIVNYKESMVQKLNPNPKFSGTDKMLADIRLIKSRNIDLDTDISIYRQTLISELKKNGATNLEIQLISDEMIVNAIKNNRQVEDVVWAILQ